MGASGSYFLSSEEETKIVWVSGSFRLAGANSVEVQASLDVLEGSHAKWDLQMQRSANNFSFFDVGAPQTLSGIGSMIFSVEVGGPAMVRAVITVSGEEPPLSARGTLEFTSRQLVFPGPNPVEGMLSQRLPELLLKSRGPYLPDDLLPKSLLEAICRRHQVEG